jgi:hypothetical protein
MDEDDEVLQWTDENFRKQFEGEHPRHYHVERQLFMLVYYDYMHMELDLGGRYPSEACDISYLAAHSAYSYSWII